MSLPHRAFSFRSPNVEPPSATLLFWRSLRRPLQAMPPSMGLADSGPSLQLRLRYPMEHMSRNVSQLVSRSPVRADNTIRASPVFVNDPS
jgi:hypothetical protein